MHAGTYFLSAVRSPNPGMRNIFPGFQELCAGCPPPPDFRNSARRADTMPALRSGISIHRNRLKKMSGRSYQN